MPIEINAPIVIISEGEADKSFLKALAAKYIDDGICCFPFPNSKFHSSSMFSNMLSAIRADVIGFGMVKGIIIVADSCDSPTATLATVISQINEAKNYPIPSKLGEVVTEDGLPALAVITLPGFEISGGLESLFAAEIGNRYASVFSDAKVFLGKSPAGLDGWNTEKQAKALYAVMVAATHRDDPSRSASFAFRSPATVMIDSEIFDPIGTILADIIRDMLSN